MTPYIRWLVKLALWKLLKSRQIRILATDKFRKTGSGFSYAVLVHQRQKTAPVFAELESVNALSCRRTHVDMLALIGCDSFAIALALDGDHLKSRTRVGHAKWDLRLFWEREGRCGRQSTSAIPEAD